MMVFVDLYIQKYKDEYGLRKYKIMNVQLINFIKLSNFINKKLTFLQKNILLEKIFKVFLRF